MNEEEIKAEELLQKFINQLEDVGCDKDYVKRDALACAKIAVDEILKNIEATILYHKESKALPLNESYWLGVKEALNYL
jgi:predicted component of type VI protein secretion system